MPEVRTVFKLTCYNVVLDSVLLLKTSFGICSIVTKCSDANGPQYEQVVNGARLVLNSAFYKL